MDQQVDGRTLAGTRLTAQQRRDRGRQAYLAGAVATIRRRVGDLSSEQREALLDALSGGN